MKACCQNLVERSNICRSASDELNGQMNAAWQEVRGLMTDLGLRNVVVQVHERIHIFHVSPEYWKELVRRDRESELRETRWNTANFLPFELWHALPGLLSSIEAIVLEEEAALPVKVRHRDSFAEFVGQLNEKMNKKD